MDKMLELQVNGTLLLQRAEEGITKIIDSTAENFGKDEYSKKILKLQILMIKEAAIELGKAVEFHNQMFKYDKGNTEKKEGNSQES